MSVKRQGSIVFGWIATSIFMAIIGLTVVPTQNVEGFFLHEFIWFEALSILFWGSLFFYVFVSFETNDSNVRFGAIAPTAFFIIGTYTFLSFLTWVFDSLLSHGTTSSEVNWIMQLRLALIAIFSIVVLTFAREMATKGIKFDEKKALKPKEIHDLLAAREALFQAPEMQEIRAFIKQLRELVYHTFSESKALSDSAQYQDLSNDIKKFADHLSTLSDSSEQDQKQLGFLSESACRLIAKTRITSTRQVVR